MLDRSASKQKESDSWSYEIFIHLHSANKHTWFSLWYPAKPLQNRYPHTCAQNTHTHTKHTHTKQHTHTHTHTHTQTSNHTRVPAPSPPRKNKTQNMFFLAGLPFRPTPNRGASETHTHTHTTHTHTFRGNPLRPKNEPLPHGKVDSNLLNFVRSSLETTGILQTLLQKKTDFKSKG